MCWMLWQDVGVDARAGGAGVEAERVPHADGQGGAGQARPRALARPTAAAPRQTQVEDVNERRQRPVCHIPYYTIDNPTQPLQANGITQPWKMKRELQRYHMSTNHAQHIFVLILF